MALSVPFGGGCQDFACEPHPCVVLFELFYGSFHLSKHYTLSFRVFFCLCVCVYVCVVKNQKVTVASFGFFSLFFLAFSLFLNPVSSAVKNILPQNLSPPGGNGPWQQQQQQGAQSTSGGTTAGSSQGPPSPSSVSSGSTSPGAYSPSRTLDLSGSTSSFSSDRIRDTHQWKNGPVEEWSNEQVGVSRRGDAKLGNDSFRYIFRICLPT